MNRKIILLCLFSLVAIAALAQRPRRRVAPPPPPARSLVDSQFYMAVEDVFPVQGRGIAITGRVSTGSITVGSSIEVKGLEAGKKTLIVSDLEVGGNRVSSASAGTSVGILVANGITATDVKRGMVVSAPNFGDLEAIATVKIKFVNQGFTEIRDGYSGTININGIDIPNSEFVFSDRSMVIRPGMEAEFNVHFAVPVVMVPNLMIAVRHNGRILGSGKIVMY
jgi:translation elongation factor EF-Tu-like GTPase